MYANGPCCDWPRIRTNDRRSLRVIIIQIMKNANFTRKGETTREILKKLTKIGVKIAITIAQKKRRRANALIAIAEKKRKGNMRNQVLVN